MILRQCRGERVKLLARALHATRRDRLSLSNIRADAADEVVDQPVLLALACACPDRRSAPCRAPSIPGAELGQREIPLQILALMRDTLRAARFPVRLQFAAPCTRSSISLALRVVLGLRLQVRSSLARQRSVDVLLFGVFEEREDRVVLLLADRIELVVVALRAAHGQPQPRGADGVRAIDDLLEAGFGAIDARLRDWSACCEEIRWRLAAPMVAFGSRSPASCSIVNSSNGMSRFSASITHCR